MQAIKVRRKGNSQSGRYSLDKILDAALSLVEDYYRSEWRKIVEVERKSTGWEYTQDLAAMFIVPEGTDDQLNEFEEDWEPLPDCMVKRGIAMLILHDIIWPQGYGKNHCDRLRLVHRGQDLEFGNNGVPEIAEFLVDFKTPPSAIDDRRPSLSFAGLQHENDTVVLSHAGEWGSQLPFFDLENSSVRGTLCDETVEASIVARQKFAGTLALNWESEMQAQWLTEVCDLWGRIERFAGADVIYCAAHNDGPKRVVRAHLSRIKELCSGWFDGGKSARFDIEIDRLVGLFQSEGPHSSSDPIKEKVTFPWIAQHLNISDYFTHRTLVGNVRRAVRQRLKQLIE